jgi:O-antigen/teichoic acid export membrane protein
MALISRTDWLRSFKLKRFQHLGQEVVWIILGQVATAVGSLVGVRFLTELVNPTVYGELAIWLTVATLVNQTVMGPLGAGITRFYSAAMENNDLSGYLNAVRQLVLFATSIITLIMLVASVSLLIVGQTGWIANTLAALLFALIVGYNSILSGIQNAARQRSIVALHQGLESWTRFLAAAGLIFLFGATSSVILLGYVVGIILVLGSQFSFFRKVVPKVTTVAIKETNWHRQVWDYSWPFLLWGIFTWVQIASDRWALQFFATPQELGMYAVLFQLGYYPISMITGMTLQFLAPIFYQRAGDASDNRRNASVNNLGWYLTSFSLGMTFLVVLVAFFFHKQIFLVFVATEYERVSYLLPWMMLSGGLFAAGQTVSLSLMSQLKTRRMVIAKITTALFGVTFNFAGAYWYGTTGVITASILFSMSYLLWMTVLLLSERVNDKVCNCA